MVVVRGNDPPTFTNIVPAEPTVPLSVWAPELIALVVTVSVLVPFDIANVAGTVIVSTCPPSPVAVSAADVGAGLEVAATPIPVTATALAPAVRLTVPAPDCGRLMRPNERFAPLLMLSVRNTVAVTWPLDVTAPPPALVVTLSDVRTGRGISMT